MSLLIIWGLRKIQNSGKILRINFVLQKGVTGSSHRFPISFLAFLASNSQRKNFFWHLSANTPLPATKLGRKQIVRRGGPKTTNGPFFKCINPLIPGGPKINLWTSTMSKSPHSEGGIHLPPLQFSPLIKCTNPLIPSFRGGY